MPRNEKLKRILELTRDQWDNSETRSAVRSNFRKVLDCGTLALGAELYASENEARVVPHSCKSRSCPACGSKSTIDWQRQQFCRLPDGVFFQLVLTMPCEFSSVFKDNRHLLYDLPAVAGSVVQQWARAAHGADVFCVVVMQTFGGRLNWHPHFHILISAGGYKESEGRWIPCLQFNQTQLMELWRYGVVEYLSQALKASLIQSQLPVSEFRKMLRSQSGREWNIHLQSLGSKTRFLNYAGRYIRRLPLPQQAILRVSRTEVEFVAKDTRRKRREKRTLPIGELVALLGQHVADRYRNAARYYGLCASHSQNVSAVFVLLGQERRRRPPRLRWAASLKKYFKIDPLLDHLGERMLWVGRRSPLNPQKA